MAKFLIVGKSYKPLVEKIENAGHSWLFLKDSQVNSGYSKKRENTYYCDLSTYQSTSAGLDGVSEDIDGILNVYENYVLASAWIGEILNLPAISEEAAEASSNKYVMRTKFRNAPEKISPDFEWADDWQTVEKFANDHHFPLILKPASLSKSLMVTKNHDMEELRVNFELTQTRGPEVYTKYAPGKKPRFIVEEFLEGRIFSVDGYADADGNITMLDVVVDYETGYNIGFDDNFHYSRIIPSNLSATDQETIRNYAAMGMRTLGMVNTPAHCELILTEDGPRIVEIGARNGGYRDRMHGLANDIDIYGAMMDLAQGKPVTVDSQRNDGCAVLEIFPRQRGKFTRLENEDQLRALSSFNDLRIIPKVGDEIGKSSEGFKMVARVVLYNENLEQFHKDLDYIKQNVKIITE